MANVSSVKISVPTKTAGEIIREELVSKILNSQKKFTYIHGGAGYGKTTLLAQAANSVENAVWLTLDGESDIFSFLDLLSEAIHHTFPCCELNFSQYLPFEGKSNFITILARCHKSVTYYFNNSIIHVAPLNKYSCCEQRRLYKDSPSLPVHKRLPCQAPEMQPIAVRWYYSQAML